MYQNDAQKVLTGEVRLSYANLLQPRTPQGGGDPKYSVTLLIQKTDTATKADMDRSIQAAIQDGVGTKWQGHQPPQIHMPIHDGDGTKENGEPFGEECKGCWVMSASSKQKPEVVESTLQPITSASDIYSGMYARVTIRFFAYKSSGKCGIGCGLGNVMKTRDGDSLGGHASAKSDFEGIAQPVQTAGAYQQADGAPDTAGTPQPYNQQYPNYAPQPPAQPTQQNYATQAPAEMPQGYPQAQGYPAYGGQAPQQYYAQQPQYNAVDPATGLPIQR